MGLMKNAILEEAGKAAQDITEKVLIFPEPRQWFNEIYRYVYNRVEQAFYNVLLPDADPGLHGRLKP